MGASHDNEAHLPLLTMETMPGTPVVEGDVPPAQPPNIAKIRHHASKTDTPRHQASEQRIRVEAHARKASEEDEDEAESTKHVKPLQLRASSDSEVLTCERSRGRG